MKIFTVKQIRNWDEYTITKQKITSTDLMERAAIAFTDWYYLNFAVSKRVVIFCGPGNNGGDGLAIARLLFERNYSVWVYKVVSEKYSSDFLENEKRLPSGIKLVNIDSEEFELNIPADYLIVDALLGTGLNKPLSGRLLKLTDQLNKLSSVKISVDIATGLYSDELPQGTVFCPDFSITFQSPRFNQLLPSNAAYTGKLVVLDIGLAPEFEEKTFSDKIFLTPEFIRKLIKPRPKFSHKGTFGKVLVIAGKYGSFGASVLTARAAYKAGAGLVYASLPETGVQIMQIAVPEVVVMPSEDKYFHTALSDYSDFSAVAVGPGIAENENNKILLRNLFENNPAPTVIDASALNLLAKNKELLDLVPPHCILTPHPKEFERLVGKYENDHQKLKMQLDFAKKLNSYILLKGAHSTLATPEGVLYFNSTGNAGMATGGSGDVLTGIIAGLLAQKYEPLNAALLGMYLHGFAGDQAVNKTGMASLMASDISDSIASFWREVEAGS